MPSQPQPQPPRLELQIACASGGEIPGRDQVESWAAAALNKIRRRGGEVTVRVVDRPEMTDLNRRYRGKTGPTNVLSFPFEAAAAGLPPLDILGDVVICAPVVAAQAARQRKPPMEHWALLVIHGILHLCGFDHQRDAEAARMEALERAILADFGIAHPRFHPQPHSHGAAQ